MAVDRMVEHAQALGGNAAVGLRFDSTEMGVPTMWDRLSFRRFRWEPAITHRDGPTVDAGHVAVARGLVRNSTAIREISQRRHVSPAELRSGGGTVEFTAHSSRTSDRPQCMRSSSLLRQGGGQRRTAPQRASAEAFSLSARQSMFSSARRHDDEGLATSWFDLSLRRALRLHGENALHVFLYVYGASGTLNVLVLVAGTPLQYTAALRPPRSSEDDLSRRTPVSGTHLTHIPHQRDPSRPSLPRGRRWAGRRAQGSWPAAGTGPRHRCRTPGDPGTLRR